MYDCGIMQCACTRCINSLPCAVCLSHCVLYVLLLLCGGVTAALQSLNEQSPEVSTKPLLA
jgi:hypothetical protein